MQTQTAYSGVVHNDAADFKKRVEESLAKLKGTKPSEPAKPEAAPAATPAPAPPSAPEAAPQPAPAAPAPEELATIVVKSIPDGADITVDGKFVGSTPSTVRLPPGDHTVVLQKSGYKTWQRTLAVSLGNTITVGPALEKNAE
jgi:pyruvate/2-oxoglutarate dehydrogenase complex dihydrolipoamide acyltransferase (E2) component